MLPGLAALLQSYQQNMLLAARARQERENALQKEKALEFKRQFIQHVEEISQDLVGLAKTRPDHAYIHLQILYFDLNRFEITPDDLENVAEKENLVLLARKLNNIEQIILANITEAQQNHTRRYLQTLSDRNQARIAVERLQFYLQWQEKKEELASARRKRRTLTIWQWTGCIILAILLAVTFQLHFQTVGPHSAAGHLILWLLAGLILGLGYLFRLGKDMPKNIPALSRECQELAGQGNVDDTAFWDQIKEVYGPNLDFEAIEARRVQLDNQLEEIETGELGVLDRE